MLQKPVLVWVAFAGRLLPTLLTHCLLFESQYVEAHCAKTAHGPSLLAGM
jgi:hypothetical protein